MTKADTWKQIGDIARSLAARLEAARELNGANPQPGIKAPTYSGEGGLLGEDAAGGKSADSLGEISESASADLRGGEVALSAAGEASRSELQFTPWWRAARLAIAPAQAGLAGSHGCFPSAVRAWS